MLDRGNPGTDAEQWGKYRNQFASPSIAHSQGAGSRCWILAVDGPQSNPDSWSIDLRCYWATIGRNAVSANANNNWNCGGRFCCGHTCRATKPTALGRAPG